MAKTLAQLQADINALVAQAAIDKKTAKDELNAAKAEAKVAIDLLREEIRVLKESKIVKKLKRVFRYAL